MRKFTLFFAALCCTVMANAWNLQVDGICYNVNWSDYTATVTYETKDANNYKNLSGNVTIPATVRGDLTDFTVIAIGDSAFMKAKNITQVDLSATSITKIGKYAFDTCTKLSNVNFPPSVTSLGNNAFYYCLKLATLNLPDDLQTVGAQCFMYCHSLIALRIPDKVTKIKTNTFADCVALQYLELPVELQEVGYNFIYKCNALQIITIHATVPPTIGDYGYGSINNPKSITLRVPYGSKSLYQEASGWKDFNIEEMKNPHEGIDQPTSDSSLKGRGKKLIKDGQLLIERNGKTYNALGAELK